MMFPHKITRIFSKQETERILELIRSGVVMTRGDKMSLLVMLSIPSILAQITSVMMFFIDASMVGRLGAAPSAAVGLVETTTWLLHGAISATSIGFSVQLAHAVGANNMQKARDVMKHALVCALVISTLIAIIGSCCAFQLPRWLGGSADIIEDAGWYFLVWVAITPIFQMSSLFGSLLKSSGDMRVPSITSIVMCVLDVIFNYVFIFVLGMGVTGAAIGSALAILVGAAVQMYFALVRSHILALRLDTQAFVWDWRVVRKAAKIAYPMALQTFFLNGAQIISTVIVAPLGAIAIATNSFGITAESLCYMPGYGIADAATTLVGQSVGAKRHELTWSFARMAVATGMGVMAFMGAVMWIFAPEMMALLSPVEAIQSLGVEVLRIEAWAEPMFAASIVCSYCMIGGGFSLHPAVANLATMWGVRLTLAALLAPVWGLKGVWIAMAVELCIRGLVQLVLMRRTLKFHR